MRRVCAADVLTAAGVTDVVSLVTDEELKRRASFAGASRCVG
jgi:hypothetical protein